jgi:hypothetical protein
MSWDALNGIREGEQNAKAAARAKRRGAALARRASSSKSKSGISRSAGRAAVARSGRGIIIHKQKNGKDFKGLISYATDPKKNPQFIFSNCGNDPKSALRTMCRAAALRPAISNPVSHITLSLPPRTGKGEERWTEIINELREQIGLDDSYPCIAIRHRDGTDHDHTHFIYSRVSVAGQVFDEWGIKLKCAVAAESIEKKLALKIFPRNIENVKTNIGKEELELGLRKGVQPPRLQIAAALKIAIKGKPTTQQFVERLNAAGVGVKANVASTGRMNGFSFIYEGIAFSGSKISKEYGWKALSEEGIDYEARDLEFIKQLDGTTGTAGTTLADSATIINQLSQSVERVATTTHDDREISADAAPAPDRTIQSPDVAKSKTPARHQKPTPTVLGRSKISDNDMRGRADSLHRRRGRVPEVSSLITPPDIKAERWRRSERLLTEIRRGLKTKVDIAELDRVATAAGHDPADIISAHATALDKLPSEIAQDVLKAAPTKEMREYIEREFKAAKKRFEASNADDRHDDQPGYRPRM